MRIYWNEDWGFTKEYRKEMLYTDYAQESLTPVRLPHSVCETPYHYFSSSSYEMVSGYRKEFFAPGTWRTKHILFTIEGAAHQADVYLNGVLIGSHHCGYTAMTVDLSKHLLFDTTNILVIRLDSREQLNQPPFGNVVDYMTYGGIYRDVYIDIKEEHFIDDVFVRTASVTKDKKQLFISTTINDCQKRLSVKNTLLNADQETVAFLGSHELATKDQNSLYEISDVSLWTLDSPVLYYIKTELYHDGALCDTKLTRFGFREAVFLCDGFYLNGEHIRLRGLNRHQAYPYIGYAMPKRGQCTDARILKEELGVNCVRTSHYPQSQHFIDACDELGLLVFTEIPGWRYIGDEEWKHQCIANVTDMVVQYRNHPSIILWGVRINESVDDDELYEKTNTAAHQMDSSRQTGGVRYLPKSHLLEDVYTYNDFIHSGNNGGVTQKKDVTDEPTKPYLISEFNGHMFPAKSFDNEDIRLEHALRHANVLNDFYANKNITGAIGWCMFDYNTHQDFGSGDHICYHGVLDMFRNPKLAASVYASQSDDTPVFELSSSMDIGEHPACYLGNVYAFTNADSIKVYKNDTFIKEFYPDQSRYGSLVHPPIIIDDFIGETMEKAEHFSHSLSEQMKDVLAAILKYGQSALPLKYKLKMAKIMLLHHITLERGMDLYSKYVANWGDKTITYRFEAIKDNQVMKVIQKAPQSSLKLHIQSDTTALKETNSYDVATIRISMQDQNDNPLPLYQDPVTITVSGPLTLIGPSVVPLRGGMAGTYVKTTGSAGEAVLCVTSCDGQKQEIHFIITKEDIYES